MATWDDVFIDMHPSQKPDETEVIPPLGQGRGKPTKDITCIALPKAALKITKEKQPIPWSTSGRGRASLVKARALTASPPIRRPGEKVVKQPSSIFNPQESFPPLSASCVTASLPKWHREKTLAKSNKGNTSTAATRVSAGEGIRSSTAPWVVTEIKGDLLASSDGSDIIIIENFPKTITEKDLVELISRYGDVLACTLEKDKHGRSLGTAVVRMESRSACERILSKFNGEEYPGAKEPMVCRLLMDDL
ncbi:ELAV-like protein 1 [Acropora muricata]|uniref:ELAV-like protein 1 n=1 Tax=Acropora muricata TaxID=159855 RepID=UPI0034E5DC56